jgi:hypothetical protein
MIWRLVMLRMRKIGIEMDCCGRAVLIFFCLVENSDAVEIFDTMKNFGVMKKI